MNYIDVSMMQVSETKLDDSFPTAQFLLDRFSKPYRLGCCSICGRIFLYVKDGISFRLLREHRLPDNTECLFIEIKIRNKKWHLCYLYNPHKNNISNHIFHLGKGFHSYITHYDNILFLGDFNSQLSENCVNDFCNFYNLSNLFKEPTCFKRPDDPSCIDMFLTNCSKCYQSTIVNKKQKLFTTEIIKLLMPICFRKNLTMNY